MAPRTLTATLLAITTALLTSCASEPDYTPADPTPATAPDKAAYLHEVRFRTGLDERLWPDRSLIAIGKVVCDSIARGLELGTMYDGAGIVAEDRDWITDASRQYLCP